VFTVIVVDYNSLSHPLMNTYVRLCLCRNQNLKRNYSLYKNSCRNMSDYARFWWTLHQLTNVHDNFAKFNKSQHSIFL